MAENQNNEFQRYIAGMKNLYERLLSFIGNSEIYEEDCNDFNELKTILSEQKILQHDAKLKSFLSLILNICNNHHRSSYFLKKIL